MFRLRKKYADKIRIRIICCDVGRAGSACTLPDNILLLNGGKLSWLLRTAFDPTQAQPIKGRRES
jgi:hypothetical protein